MMYCDTGTITQPHSSEDKRGGGNGVVMGTLWWYAPKGGKRWGGGGLLRSDPTRSGCTEGGTKERVRWTAIDCPHQNACRRDESETRGDARRPEPSRRIRAFRRTSDRYEGEVSNISHWGQIPVYWSGKCWLNCKKMENIPSNYLLSKWWFFSEFTGSSKCLVFLQFAGSHDHHFLIG